MKQRPMPSTLHAPDTTPAAPAVPPAGPVALQRIDRFVARTQNWFYDHMRYVPRHRPVVVCTSLENREEFPDLAAVHVSDLRLGWRVWNRLLRGRLYPPDAWRLRAYRPVVFHSHLGYVAVGDTPYVDALELPWVVSFYGADVYLLGRHRQWHERYAPMFARAAAVLSLGPAMSAALAELGCPADKIIIHPLGVDARGLPHATRERRPGDPLRLLFSGTMREKKGGIYLIEALGLLKQKGIPFHLDLVGNVAGRAGDNETRDAMFRRIGELGLTDQVTHHSWLAFKDLIALGLRCHIFVAPSVTAADGDSEGTPAVMGQMMATGMAVIATRHSDIPYTFGPHADRLLPERNAAAIAEALEQYWEEPGRLSRDGAALRHQILHHFDLQVCAPRLSDLYDRLAPGGGR